MTLGQMMLVAGALVLLGLLVLNASTTIIETSDTQAKSEFGITAVSLATSLVEEAMGKVFDEVVSDSNLSALTDSSLLSSVLGPDGPETYRGGVNDFNDFDDFNGLFIAYRSDHPSDTAGVPGAHRVITVPGIRARYYVKAKVNYVNPTALDDTSAVKRFHKKITVTVTSPRYYGPGQKADTLRFPAVMSYWN